MQKLNIPLSRHIKTTRPLRQVVWLLGGLTLALVFVTWRAGEWWFSRDSILQAAPEGTILAVDLELTKSSTPTLLALFRDIPLISNRSLEIADLASLTQGELALFLTSAGDRSVAIRANTADLPRELLTSLAITVQDVAPGILLLSQTLLPISGIESDTHAPLFPSLTSEWLGRIDLPDDNLSGSIIVRNGQLELIFQNQNKEKVSGEFLPMVMLALSGHGSHLSALSSKELDTFEHILEQDWNIVVAEDDLGSLALLVKAPKGETTQEDLMNLLQLIGAYLSPTLKETGLKDGTSLKEILVDPTLVTVEQVQIAQIEAFRVVGASQHAVYGAFFENQIIFSTGEDLILQLSETRTESICTGNVLNLEPASVMKQMAIEAYNPTLFSLKKILSQFSAISIEMNRYSSIVHFCST